MIAEQKRKKDIIKAGRRIRKRRQRDKRGEDEEDIEKVSLMSEEYEGTGKRKDGSDREK